MPVEPVNRGVEWRHLPLTEDRTPLRGYTKRAHPEYWQGSSVSWAEACEYTSSGKAIGTLTHGSELVVLDCDVKVEWRADGGSAGQVVRHGIEDLKRAAAEQGEVIPPTFTVRSRSGGYHLYYQAVWSGLVSKGHRDDWLIDVKASPNTWVVAPPTAGYEVIRDLPVAPLPGWLMAWVTNLNSLRRPLGGRPAQELMTEIRRLAMASGAGNGGGTADLLRHWVDLNLALVRLASEAGGWNNRIYEVCRQFFDVGMGVGEVEELVMGAAEPWNEAEVHNVRRTVASAWAGHQYNERRLGPSRQTHRYVAYRGEL